MGIVLRDLRWQCTGGEIRLRKDRKTKEGQRCYPDEHAGWMPALPPELLRGRDYIGQKSDRSAEDEGPSDDFREQM
ncbi:MAG TPA: hypothetical protein VHC90_12330 [Bryobacteraceae bacterium]|nr:hypothetical protein [Bryobacteraceae bacterium]